MRLLAVLLVCVLAAPALAGCMDTPPHVLDWNDEARAHGTMGQSATLDLHADDHVLLGEGTVHDTSGPFLIENHPRGTRTEGLAFFHGTVAGVGTGLIILEGDRITVSSGIVHSLPTARITNGQDGVRVESKETPTAPVDFEFPDDAKTLGMNWFFAKKSAVDLGGFVIDDAERALLLMNGTMTDLDFPVRFDAELLGLERRSALLFPELVVHFEHFAYGGNTPRGSVLVQDNLTLRDPVAVFGTNATFRIEGPHLASMSPFRLTQALTKEGYAVRAEIDLRAEYTEYIIDAGNLSWIRTDIREKGYLGSAILHNITVTGSAAALITVPTARPPGIIDELWSTVSDAGYMAPFVALPVAVASPFLLAGEALLKGLDCLTEDCPAERPYPVWLEPGTIDRFYYQVDATDAAPGTYEGTIRFTGANHAPVELPVRVHVH